MLPLLAGPPHTGEAPGQDDDDLPWLQELHHLCALSREGRTELGLPSSRSVPGPLIQQAGHSNATATLALIVCWQQAWRLWLSRLLRVGWLLL